MSTAENLAGFGAPNAIAKSTKAVLIRRIARLVRQEGLNYEGWRYVAKKVRQLCRLKPAKKGRKLPNVLTAAEFQRFYQAVDRAANAQHALMLRLLFYTGIRKDHAHNRGRGAVPLPLWGSQPRVASCHQGASAHEGRKSA